MQSVSETTRRRVWRRRICLLALAAATAAVGAVPPATGNHSLLHLGAGGLSVSQPASAHLGTASTGAAGLQAPLVTVTVTDARNLSLGGYTVQVIVGDNTSTWNPTITVTLPADAVAGVYSGTITHSVA
jgi:hypothetical protein